MKTVECPAGHGFNVPPVVFGYPLPETLEAADRGEVILGGCLPDMPVETSCPTCGLPVEVSGVVSGEPRDRLDDRREGRI